VLRPAIALLLALLASLTTTTTAQATTTTWRQSLAAANGTTSTGTITWNNTTFTEQLTVRTATLAAGKCVTVFFDWVSHTHNDARAIRDCRSNDTLTFSFSEGDTSQLSGKASKFGMCYGVKDQRGTCVGQKTITNDWTPWPDTTRTAPCDLSWVLRSSTGTQTSFMDPHPTSAALRAGGTC
jgi:hypothetical protein